MAPQIMVQKPGQVNLSLVIFGVRMKRYEIFDVKPVGQELANIRDIRCHRGALHQNQIPFIRPEILETEPAVLSIQATTVK